MSQSQKPELPPQNCLGPAKHVPTGKGRPTQKPQVEWVVQLGPFTEGQISTGDSQARPLEGPTDWVIRPKSGEISPFEAGRPPEKNVIRKYITVGAQDNDAPQDLPKLSEGYVIERTRADVVPEIDNRVHEREAPRPPVANDRVLTETVTKTETIVGPKEIVTVPGETVYVDKEVIKYVTIPCKPPEPPPVCEKPPVCPPEKPAETDCEKPPVCPPEKPTETDCEKPSVNPPEKPAETDCEKPPVNPPEKPAEIDCEKPPVNPPEKPAETDCEKPPVCKPVVHAVDDCVSTEKNTAVTIDVLDNDKGNSLTMTKADAAHGKVEIVDNQLHYTPNEGFSGKDHISYSISDGGCASDEGNVFVTVTAAKTEECKDTTSTTSACDDVVTHDGDCKTTTSCETNAQVESQKDTITAEVESVCTAVAEYQYSPAAALFVSKALDSICGSTTHGSTDSAADTKATTNWSSACHAQQSFAPACALATEEACAVC